MLLVKGIQRCFDINSSFGLVERRFPTPLNFWPESSPRKRKTLACTFFSSCLFSHLSFIASERALLICLTEKPSHNINTKVPTPRNGVRLTQSLMGQQNRCCSDFALDKRRPGACTQTSLPLPSWLSILNYRPLPIFSLFRSSTFFLSDPLLRLHPCALRPFPSFVGGTFLVH